MACRMETWLREGISKAIEKKESKNYQRDVDNRKQRYNQKVMKERRTTVSRNGLSNNQTNITQVSQ